MTKIISIANQKGGVGKTTTAINISAALAALGYEVLLVDMDPQGNASTGLGVEHAQRRYSTYELMVGQCDVNQVVVETNFPKLSVLPSKLDLAAVDVEMADRKGKEFILKNHLLGLKKRFDYIFIDCPPSINCLTVNSLAASGSVLIPLQCEFFALEGVAHLTHSINLIRRSLNPGLKIEGILLTMVDRRNKLTTMVEEDVRSTFVDLVYETIIPRNVKLSEAPSHGQPAVVYDIKCLGSVSYIMLVREIIKKNQLNINQQRCHDKLSA